MIQIDAYLLFIHPRPHMVAIESRPGAIACQSQINILLSQFFFMFRMPGGSLIFFIWPFVCRPDKIQSASTNHKYFNWLLLPCFSTLTLEPRRCRERN